MVAPGEETRSRGWLRWRRFPTEKLDLEIQVVVEHFRIARAATHAQLWFFQQDRGIR